MLQLDERHDVRDPHRDPSIVSSEHEPPVDDRVHPWSAQRQTVVRRNANRGLRVLEYLAAGMTTDEIVADFPELTVDHVRAALEFAALRERRLATST